MFLNIKKTTIHYILLMFYNKNIITFLIEIEK